jgi:hypothetical protein
MQHVKEPSWFGASRHVTAESFSTLKKIHVFEDVLSFGVIRLLHFRSDRMETGAVG